MRILAIADTRNRRFRRDGDEFKRQMYDFAHHWQLKGATVTAVEISHKKNWMKHRDVLKAIEEQDGDIDVLALFCHGWKSGISLGFKNYHVPDLVEALFQKSPRWKDVVLYACTTARKPGDFGWRLARGLNDNGMLGTVTGHSTKGHCTRNPMVYETSGKSLRPFWTFLNLPWYKRRKSPRWKAWRERLQGPDRFDFWS